MALMTLERFAALAEAYGGELGRWPRDEREQAGHLLYAEPFMARRMLAEAARLDRVLNRSRSPVPTRQLVERVLAAAPVRASAEVRRWWVGAGVGAGLAAACAAGLVVGVLAAPLAMRPSHVDALPGSVGDPTEEAAMLLREPPDLADG